MFKQRVKSENSFKARFLAGLASLWMRSLRIELHTPVDFGPGILGLWHRDVIASVSAFKDMGVHMMVSQSKDGEPLSLAAENLGYKVTRGSDSHGATNVRHILKSLNEGSFAGMALDGPRGPALEIKPGSPWLARRSGRPLWLLKPTYGSYIVLNTWDKMIIPLPFSKIRMYVQRLDV